MSSAPVSTPTEFTCVPAGDVSRKTPAGIYLWFHLCPGVDPSLIMCFKLHCSDVRLVQACAERDIKRTLLYLNYRKSSLKSHFLNLRHCVSLQ